MKMKFTLFGLLGTAIIWNIAPSAQAQIVQCQGILGKITVESIQVPANRLCVLRGTTVLKNVVVGNNGRLLVSQAKIKGNVLAKNALYLELGNLSEVEGFIQRPSLLRSPWP